MFVLAEKESIGACHGRGLNFHGRRSIGAVFPNVSEQCFREGDAPGIQQTVVFNQRRALRRGGKSAISESGQLSRLSF
jgi:hypothetical protein